MLAGVPVLVGIAVRIETGDGGPGGGGGGGEGGPAFLSQVTHNGLFLVFTSLAVTLPFFLPMSVGVIAGDSLMRRGARRDAALSPGRPRGPHSSAAGQIRHDPDVLPGRRPHRGAVRTGDGRAALPLGEVTLLSGTSVSLGEGLLRALAIAVAVALSLTGVAAVGLFVSTLTTSGIAAMATTVGLLITVQILDTLPQLHAIQPYLFPHYWLSFADLLRDPVYWDQLQKNLGLQALYALVFGSAAWARFTTRDVTA